MILTITLNAAVDRTLVVPSLSLGHRHRASESVTLAGGKGINVARGLRTLGVPVLATGFAGGRNGDAIRDGLRSEEHTSELQSRQYFVCRLLLDKKNTAQPPRGAHTDA